MWVMAALTPALAISAMAVSGTPLYVCVRPYMCVYAPVCVYLRPCMCLCTPLYALAYTIAY